MEDKSNFDNLLESWTTAISNIVSVAGKVLDTANEIHNTINPHEDDDDDDIESFISTSRGNNSPKPYTPTRYDD